MITITVEGNSPVSVNWYSGMNAQQALEEAYKQITFGVNYYGSSLGYMVVMLNQDYDAPGSCQYWEFLLNGSPATVGIDSTILNDADSISFNNVTYCENKHKNTLVEIKHIHANNK